MKHAVITGAADGIGRALALTFGRAGYAITGIDIDPAKAEEAQRVLATQGVDARFILADLAQTEELPRIVKALHAAPAIDVLVHCAGISAVGAFQKVGLERQERVLRVNLVAPLLLTPPLLAHLTPTASLIFIASLSHFTAYPGASVYAASKDALVSYARSLRVTRRDLHVLTVFPGPTRTEHARRYSPPGRSEAQRMPPEKLAQGVLEATLYRRPILIPGVGNKLMALLGRFCPTLAERLMRRFLFVPLQDLS